MKCKRCGKGVGVTRRGQAIADGYVCYKCLDELGFSKSDRSLTPWALSFWEIENGKSRINYTRAARKGKHEDWLKKHQDVTAFMEALDEDLEADEAVSDGDPEMDEF